MINVITKAAARKKEMIILGDFIYEYKFDETLCNNPRGGLFQRAAPYTG
jgi:hypothetical protein